METNRGAGFRPGAEAAAAPLPAASRSRSNGFDRNLARPAQVGRDWHVYPGRGARRRHGRRGLQRPGWRARGSEPMDPFLPDDELTRDGDLADWRAFTLAYYEPILRALRLL